MIVELEEQSQNPLLRTKKTSQSLGSLDGSTDSGEMFRKTLFKIFIDSSKKPSRAEPSCSNYSDSSGRKFTSTRTRTRSLSPKCATLPDLLEEETEEETLGTHCDHHPLID